MNAHGYAATATKAELSAQIAEWTSVLASYPESRHAHVVLAKLLTAAGKQREALKEYRLASDIALRNGHIRYSYEQAQLAVAIKDRKELDKAFASMIDKTPPDEKGHYLALVDYADALAQLGSDDAWQFFEKAITLRKRERADYAVTIYGLRLVRSGKPARALEVLNRLALPGGAMQSPGIYYVRHMALSASNADVTEIESSMRAMGLEVPSAEYAVPAAAPSGFKHEEQADDCRRDPNDFPLSGEDKIYYCPGTGAVVVTHVFNLAEVIWNEARGESFGGQAAVAWTVRNRTRRKPTCDSYPGAEGGKGTSTCRSALTCNVPLYSPPNASCDTAKRYCCVLHGGTTKVGATHLQFNDAHHAVDESICLTTFLVAHTTRDGHTRDPATGYQSPLCGNAPDDLCATNYCKRKCSPDEPDCSGCPFSSCDWFNWVGTPIDGAQEYRNKAYAPLGNSASCKQAPTTNTCTGDDSNFVCCDAPPNNYFWNRKP
ncbi:hypothetical protein AAG565_15280 [Fontimonas sp. SYSU GA230001]|uniref:hypothetical protein n=1 Tax=Fontimonas sp. SYSU GA230001 TaxID=3142450 RepID=UPI0032B4A5B7